MFAGMVAIFAIFGTIIGSFAVAQVWRIRAFQLKVAKKNGEEFSQEEWNKLNHLTKKSVRKDRSHCLNCGYVLRWCDLIPIFSWLSLGGRCRKCKTPIGKTEFFAEVATGMIFAFIFASFFAGVNFADLGFWYVLRFFILIFALIPLVILFIYDAKWSLLPVKIMYTFDILAFAFWILGFVNIGFSIESLVNILISMAIFPAVYFVLSFVSRGVWVGSGDWILAIGLVFLVPNLPVYSLMLMFFANIFALIAIFSLGIFRKKEISRGAQIPFGPAMIFAALMILIFRGFFEQIMLFLM